MPGKCQNTLHQFPRSKSVTSTYNKLAQAKVRCVCCVIVVFQIPLQWLVANLLQNGEISASTNKDDLKWPWMPDSTYSALCGRHAWHIYVCSGFRSWLCVTEWTWALTVSNKNVANELWFQSIWSLYKFSLRTAEGRRTRVEPLNLVIIHIMQCSIIFQIPWDVWPFVM